MVEGYSQLTLSPCPCFKKKTYNTFCGPQRRTEKSPRAKKCNKLGWETQYTNTATNIRVPNQQSQAHILYATNKNNRAKGRLSIPVNARRTPRLSCVSAPRKSRNHANQTYPGMMLVLWINPPHSCWTDHPLLMGRFCHRPQEIGCGGVTHIGLESWPWVRRPFSTKDAAGKSGTTGTTVIDNSYSGCSVFRQQGGKRNKRPLTLLLWLHSAYFSRVCSTIPSVEQ